MAFLTSPAPSAGRRVADTFAGRRRLVGFLETVQLECGVCFSNDDWDRGIGLDEFVQLVDRKAAKPGYALRLARDRLRSARARLVDSPIKFGLLSLPLLIPA